MYIGDYAKGHGFIGTDIMGKIEGHRAGKERVLLRSCTVFTTRKSPTAPSLRSGQ